MASVTDYGAAGDPRSGATSLAAWAAAVSAALDNDDTTVDTRIGAVTAADVGAAAASHTHALTDVTDAGGAAALDVGTTAGTVAAGDHGHAAEAWIPVAAGPYAAAPILSLGTYAATLNNAFLHPCHLVAGTLDRIGIEVHAESTAGEVRLGIYADDGAGNPGALVLDAGTVASTTTGVKEITIDLPVTAGNYWLAAAQQGSDPATLTSGVLIARLHWGNSAAAISDYNYPRVVGVQASSGALPDPAAPTSTEYRAPRVFVRYA